MAVWLDWVWLSYREQACFSSTAAAAQDSGGISAAIDRDDLVSSENPPSVCRTPDTQNSIEY